MGKRLFKLDRSEEHQLFLDWLVATLVSEKIDALLIAGDVFDTPSPPHQSLELFYKFLHRVSTETTAQTFIIAGNHDSGVLLEAPAKILTSHRVKVWGKISTAPEDHWTTLEIGAEKLELCAVPFFRSYELLPQSQGDILEALNKYLKRDKTCAQLLLLHHLAGIYEASGSEQVVSLSGVDSIPHELIEQFDYVALGHIHKPQKIGPRSYYSGSPIPMRFSETLRKSLVIIEQTDGEVTSRPLPIPVFRELVCVKADESNFVKKLEALAPASPLPPVVEVQITLSAPRVGLVDQIKEILSERGLELLSFLPIYVTGEKTPRRHEKLFELSPVELFEEFYAAKYPDEEALPAELKQDFRELLEKVKHAAPQA